MNDAPDHSPAWRCLLVVLLLGTLTVVASSAETYHSEEFGLTLEVPDGWVPIPDHALQELAEINQSPALDLAFQRPEPTDWFVYPYFAVMVLSYEEAGIGRQMYVSEFDAVLKGISFARDQQASQGGIFFTEPQLDVEKRKFSFLMRLETEEYGRIRAEAHGFFGSQSMVQIIFYSRQSEWAVYRDQRNQVLESFQFDPSHAYDEQRASPAALMLAPPPSAATEEPEPGQRELPTKDGNPGTSPPPAP